MSERNAVELALSKLDFRPGDMLVVKVPDSLTLAQANQVLKSVASELTSLKGQGVIPPETSFLVIQESFDIGLVRSPEVPAVLAAASQREVDRQQVGA